VVFLLVAIALTYPLITDMTGGIVGDPAAHEESTFAWNLWWTWHALLDLGSSPFSTDYVFYPFTVDLRLHTFAVLYGVVSIPFQLIWGAGGALNAIILLTIVLNGYASYLLARHALGDSRPALVVGTIIAVSPALTTPHLRAGKPSFAAIWPVALALLFLSRFAQERRWRDAVGMGVAMLAALLIDFQILLYASLWLAFYGAYLLLRRRDSLLDRWFLGGLLLALSIVGLPFLLIFFRPLLMAGQNGIPVPGAQATLVYSLMAKHYLSPVLLRIFFGGVLPVAVIVTVVSFLWTRRSLFWLVGGICFLVLTLGIELQPTSVPLPYAALRKLPGVAQFRTPYRFTIPATLGLALAVGGAWSYWQARWWSKRWWSLLAVLLVGLLLIDSRAVGQFGLQPYPVEPIYHLIGEQEGDFTVLEVPLGVRSGSQKFGHGEPLQFYQTIHQKRMINGMVARVPASFFDYYRDSPAFRILAGEPVPDDAHADADLERRLDALNVGYVIVHPNRLTPAEQEPIEALLERQPGLTLVEAAPTIRVYRTENAHPSR